MKSLIEKTLVSRAGLEALALRLPIGLILAAHGSQKLFAWFGGYGLAGSAEFFGGVALMLGLSTRPAAAVTAITMLVALFWVHWGNGFFLSAHGIEYALALLSASLALMIMGGGSYSIDRYLLASSSLRSKKHE